MARPRTSMVISLAALAVAGLAPDGLATSAGGSPLVWVSVAGSRELVEVDLDTRRVTARIALTTQPGVIASSFDLRKLLVASPSAGTPTLVDGVNRKVEAVFRGLGHPSAVAFGQRPYAAPSRYAYVSDQRRGRLVVLDLRRKRVASRVPAGPRPGAVVAGDLLWLATGAPSPGLRMFALTNPARPRLEFRLTTHLAIRDIALQPDSANLYVTYRGSRLIGKLNGGSRQVVWARDVGDVVGSVAFDYYAGQRLWLAAPRSGRLLLVSARSGRVLRRVTGCRGAADVALVGTRWVVAACADAGSILVYDAVTRQRVLVPVGLRPVGVAGIVG